MLTQVFVKSTTSSNFKQIQSTSLAYAVHPILFAMGQQMVMAT